MGLDSAGDGSVKVGFIGLGNLGLPMAITAVRAGLEVKGYDLEAERMDKFKAEGGHSVSKVSDVCEVDLVAIAVLDDAQVISVVDSLVGSLKAGSVVVVHSTVLPETVKRLGARLSELEVSLLDAPVSGGDIAARDGSLTVMIGGDPKDVTSVRPYLEAVGSSICLLGPLGAGSAGKLANQLMTFVNQLAALEAMKLARLYGVTESDVVELSRNSTSRSWILDNWGFFDRIYSEYEDTGTPLKLRPWSKDLWDIVVVARENEVSLPLAALAGQLATPLFEERGTGDS